jgi:hypothetical protein
MMKVGAVQVFQLNDRPGVNIIIISFGCFFTKFRDYLENNRYNLFLCMNLLCFEPKTLMKKIPWLENNGEKSKQALPLPFSYVHVELITKVPM